VTPTIIVFGSINIDLTFRVPHLPSVGETVLTPAFTQAVGGKGANQAIAAARDGAVTSFIGCVGSDTFGTSARAALADLGIETSGLKTVPGSTGLAAVWIDGDGHNQVAVASGANGALKADALCDQEIGPGTFVVLQMETLPAEVEAAIAHARRRGAYVILNLAPALPLPAPALREVAILVLNEHEAAVLCGLLALPQIEPAEQVAALARHLSTTVIITLGRAGAIGQRGGTVWQVDAFDVSVVDTTGAGDCFVGVLAAALSRGAAIGDAMQRAAAAGSLACTIVGAMPSFPTGDKIDGALAHAVQPQTKE
jgi:ribokinase